MSKKKNQFESFLEELPVETNIIEILNRNIKTIARNLQHGKPHPLEEWCKAEEVLHSHQYGDDFETYSLVYYLPDHKIHIIGKYYYNSYDGSEYEDMEFKKAESSVKHVTVFEGKEK